MKILSVANNYVNGCVLYRQIIPHLEMHRAGMAEVLFTNNTTAMKDSEVKDYDIVQYHKGYINFQQANRFIKMGKKVICDFDDYWELPMSHGLYNEYNYENFKKDGKTVFNHDEMGRMIRKKRTTTDMFKDILRKYPYITVTTPRLAERVYPYNKNVAVFENALHPKAPMMEIKPTESEFMRFGWIGGSQHWIDIQLLRGIPNRLFYDNATKGKYQIHLYGYMGGTVFDNFAEILTDYRKITEPFRAFPPLQTMHEPPDKPSYLTYYNNFDVALIPLADTKFNTLKSELKVIEAGFFKKAVIVSNIYPYSRIINDKNAMIVRKRNDWFKHIKKLIQNPNLVKDLGEQLYHDVNKSYHIDEVNKRRAEWYQSLI